MKRSRKQHETGKEDKVELAFIAKHQHGKSTREIAGELGVSQRTVQRWLSLRERIDPTRCIHVLNTRKRVPKFGEMVQAKIIALHDELPRRSASTIHRLLEKDMGMACPSAQTVRRILRNAGLTRAKKCLDKNYIAFEREMPNDLWQIDFKGWDLVGSMGKLHLLAILDDHSRYAIAARWYTDDRETWVMHLLKEAFETHGLPNEILSDNGSQFKNVVGDRLSTRYARLLYALDIKAIFHKPRHPESKGKIEKFFWFVDSSFMPDGRKYMDEHPGADLSVFNKLFGEWLEWYNFKHKHAALGRKTAHEIYSSHPGKVKRDLQVALDWDRWMVKAESRRVTKQGIISVDGKTYKLPDGHAKRRVDIYRYPGEIIVYSGDLLVETFTIASEVDDSTSLGRQRRINKDGYLKFHKRAYKIGTRHAHKIVNVLVTANELELLIYEGDRLLDRIRIEDGKQY